MTPSVFRSIGLVRFKPCFHYAIHAANEQDFFCRRIVEATLKKHKNPADGEGKEGNQDKTRANRHSLWEALSVDIPWPPEHQYSFYEIRLQYLPTY